MTAPDTLLPDADALGAEAMEKLDALAALTEMEGGLTRTFGSTMHEAALQLIAGWMAQAGMTVRRDTAANLIGRYEGTSPKAPAVMMGSHQDTVRNAGRYDGMLGIVLPILAVQALSRAGRRLDHAVEVIVFSDEEGVRFQTTLLGSKAVTGTLTEADLAARDADGITVAEALRAFGGDPDALLGSARRPGEILAFVETHIEQGPVLEAKGLPVGVVTGIVGGTRLQVDVEGVAGHAGTVPMTRRHDALTAAAEMVLAIEHYARAHGSMVATVGRLAALPGAINVIPGEAGFTVDLRALSDDERRSATDAVVEKLTDIAESREVALRVERLYDSNGAASAEWLLQGLARAIEAEGLSVHRLVSGAGHDAMAMAQLTDIAMLFVRCKGGISHNPAESITAADAATAARVLIRFLVDFDPSTRD